MFHRQRGISTQAVIIATVAVVILSALLFAIFNPSGGTQTVNGTVSPQELQPSAENQAEAEPEAQATPERDQENDRTELEQAEESTSAESQAAAEEQETAEPENETEPEQAEEDISAESEVTPEDGATSGAESQVAAETQATLDTQSAESEDQAVSEQTQEEAPSSTLETSEQVQGDSPSETQATPEQAQEDTTAEAYTVVSGDTLYSIARENNTTVTALTEANAIANPHQIGIGQVVTIPAQPTNQGENADRTYTVKSKDTLYSIAKRYTTSVDAMADINGISDSGVIKVGQVLRMPSNASPVPK